MPLLLQLNADVPSRFVTHERRLYMWACRAKRCRRKPGCVRALRTVRVHGEVDAETQAAGGERSAQEQQDHAPDIGSALFGGNPAMKENTQNGNPFAAPKGKQPASTNPFAIKPESDSTANGTGVQDSSSSNSQDLSSTFAQKARITDPASDRLPHRTPQSRPPPDHVQFEEWPQEAAPTAKPYPHFYLDADFEYLSSTDSLSFQKKVNNASHAAFMDIDEPNSSSSKSKTEKEVPDDAIDRTFQQFADILAQNPEQVLRYHFNGKPLLTRREDDVGKAFSQAEKIVDTDAGQSLSITLNGRAESPGSRLPACSYCGARCVFEYQLTPGAITVLEEEEDLATLLEEGMDWGTVVVASCERDCVDAGVREGSTTYKEQWVGVQWEEVVERGAAGKGGGG